MTNKLAILSTKQKATDFFKRRAKERITAQSKQQKEMKHLKHRIPLRICNMQTIQLSFNRGT